MVPSGRDPLDSPIWGYLAPQLFGDAPVRFASDLEVAMPPIAENQHVFPVQVDARRLGKVDRIMIFTDLSPVQLALTCDVSAAEPFVSTRIKLDQRTPVRGAARLAGGDWIVAGSWIDAAGGGCSTPPVSRVARDWDKTIGQIRGRAWRGPDGVKLRLIYKHPMDTGFVDNIPAFYIEAVTVRAPGGAVLTRLETRQSVSEDPAFTLLLRAGPEMAWLETEARDTGGSLYSARVPVGA